MSLSPYSRRKPLLKRAFVFFMAVILLAAIGGAFCWHFYPLPFRRVIVQPPREVLFALRELQPSAFFEHKIIHEKIPEPETVVLKPEKADDIKIVADIRIPEGDSPKPAVLLLHGSSPWGRKNGLILWLGYRLWERGWVVMAPDARGFGDTEDPKNIKEPKNWDVQRDIKRCMEYIEKETPLDPARLVVIGHSMGAGHALEGALLDNRVSRMVLIGPARHIHGAIDTSQWNLIRFSSDRKLDELIPESVFLAISEKSDFRAFVKKGLISQAHKPILLIDGELEGADNLNYLADLVKIAGPNLHYRTLKGTGHYCGVVSLPPTNHIFIRTDLFEPFFTDIMNFLETDF